MLLSVIVPYLDFDLIKMDNIHLEDISINNLFKSLKSHIDNQEFEAAVELLSANKDKFDPGVYHYNLASIYANQELLVKARVHYELAIQEGYISPELKAGLYKVRENLQVIEAEKPEGIIDSLNYSFASTPNEVFITIFLLLLVIILIGMRKLLWKTKILIMLILMLPVSYSYFFYKDLSVVILQEDQVVREGPSKIFEETQVMPKGMKILVGKTYSNFIEVIYPATYKGWINNSTHFYLRK